MHDNGIQQTGGRGRVHGLGELQQLDRVLVQAAKKAGNVLGKIAVSMVPVALEHGDDAQLDQLGAQGRADSKVLARQQTIDKGADTRQVVPGGVRVGQVFDDGLKAMR